MGDLDVTATAASRIGLLRLGDRPRLNTRLAALLGDAFPGHVVDDVDVLAEVRSARARYACVGAGAIAEYALPLARRRTAMKRALVRSAAFDRAASAIARRRMAPATHRFTFQSQSLFDGAVPGLPHFVYTDHVHLANLGYPAFDPGQLASSRHLRMEVRLYRASNTVFVRSNHVRDALVHGYGCRPGRVAVVGVGPNAPIPDGSAADQWSGGRILFVGVDWERKGGDVLLAAFRRLRDRHPTAELHIAGCEPSGVGGDRVYVHGRVPEHEVTRLAVASDVFCLPTRIEPFGVAFVEAMHAGLPVVGTDLGAVPDFVVPGETGELVPPDDVDAVEHALDQLLSDPDRARRMGARSREVARSRYDWPAVMTAIRDHIEHQLAEPTPEPS